MRVAEPPDTVLRAARLLPILGWLPAYRRDCLLPDFLAGLAVWAVMVPEAMAYAGIVGVPPIMGLYTIVPPLVAYAALGTSRVLVVGPDTATGLISALTVGAIAMPGTASFDTLTSTLAILIGVLFLLFGALRMGWVAAFIPTPVMRGFIEGLVCVTIVGQVPHLLGIAGTSGNFFRKLGFVLQHLPDASLAPVVTGVLSLAAMQLLRRLAPRVPAALVVATAATIIVGLLGGEAAGVSVVGDLPSGLPHLVLPNLDHATVQQLLPGALAIALVGYAEALGGAKAAAMQGGGDIDPNQELIAHGPANILSGLFGGFLVVGSLSKTSVAMAAGARTQLANLIAAVFCFLTLVLLTPLFRGMPHPALAAIVIAAMLHLSQPGYLRNLLARNRLEFGVGHGGLSRHPAPPGGAHLSRVADMAPRRRSVLCEHRAPPRQSAGGRGCQPASRETRARGRRFGELHRHDRLRRVVELYHGDAESGDHVRVRPCARPGAGPPAARRHRGRRRLGELP